MVAAVLQQQQQQALVRSGRRMPASNRAHLLQQSMALHSLEVANQVQAHRTGPRQLQLKCQQHAVTLR